MSDMKTKMSKSWSSSR